MSHAFAVCFWCCKDYRYFHSKMCGGNLLDIQGDYGKSLKGKRHDFLAYT